MYRKLRGSPELKPHGYGTTPPELCYHAGSTVQPSFSLLSPKSQVEQIEKDAIMLRVGIIGYGARVSNMARAMKIFDIPYQSGVPIRVEHFDP